MFTVTTFKDELETLVVEFTPLSWGDKKLLWHRIIVVYHDEIVFCIIRSLASQCLKSFKEAHPKLYDFMVKETYTYSTDLPAPPLTIV